MLCFLFVFLRQTVANIRHDVSHPALRRCVICTHPFGSVSGKAPPVVTSEKKKPPHLWIRSGHHATEVWNLCCCWEVNVFPTLCELPPLPSTKFLFSRSLVCESPDLLRQPDLCVIAAVAAAASHSTELPFAISGWSGADRTTTIHFSSREVMKAHAENASHCLAPPLVEHAVCLDEHVLYAGTKGTVAASPGVRRCGWGHFALAEMIVLSR